MRFLAFVLVAALSFLIALFLKAKVDFRYRRSDGKDTIDMHLYALHGLWNFQFQVPAVQMGWEKGPELEIEQEVHSNLSEGRQQKNRARLRFWRGGFFYYLWPQTFNLLQRLSRVKKQFYRGIRLTALEFDAEVGTVNPAYTAMLAGAFWSVIGDVVARLYRQVQVEVQNPRIAVVPMFQKPGFSCDFHCIFQLRIGHIIVAGLNLLRIFKWGTRG